MHDSTSGQGKWFDGWVDLMRWCTLAPGFYRCSFEKVSYNSIQAYGVSHNSHRTDDIDEWLKGLRPSGT